MTGFVPFLVSIIITIICFQFQIGFVWTLSSSSSSSSKAKTRNNKIHYNIIEPQGQVKYPPLILIGGMAQTKLSWEHHIPSLSKNRQLIIYECLGQGKDTDMNTDTDTRTTDTRTDNLDNVTLPYQAELLLQFIEHDLSTNEHEEQLLFDTRPSIRQVDLVGFSFGARVCMACACLLSSSKPGMIRRMHLSGVAVDRSDYGYLAVRAWKDCLENDESLRSFAWSILMATYTSKFLGDQPIERYIDAICNTNSREGLLALLEQSEVSDKSNPWHVSNMAERISTGKVGGVEDYKLCVGEYDQMAPIKFVEELNTKLNSKGPITIIPNCGHAVGIEGARVWKNDVLEFLNE